MKSFATLKRQALSDPEVKKEYDNLEPLYALISELIKKRIDKGITQTDLAHKIGTKQSAIARLESGSYNPSLSFLSKVARGLDSSIKIHLT